MSTVATVQQGLSCRGGRRGGASMCVVSVTPPPLALSFFDSTPFLKTEHANNGGSIPRYLGTRSEGQCVSNSAPCIDAFFTGRTWTEYVQRTKKIAHRTVSCRCRAS